MSSLTRKNLLGGMLGGSFGFITAVCIHPLTFFLGAALGIAIAWHQMRGCRPHGLVAGELEQAYRLRKFALVIALGATFMLAGLDVQKTHVRQNYQLDGFHLLILFVVESLIPSVIALMMVLWPYEGRESRRWDWYRNPVQIRRRISEKGPIAFFVSELAWLIAIQAVGTIVVLIELAIFMVTGILGFGAAGLMICLYGLFTALDRLFGKYQWAPCAVALAVLGIAYMMIASLGSFQEWEIIFYALALGGLSGATAVASRLALVRFRKHEYTLVTFLRRRWLPFGERTIGWRFNIGQRLIWN